MSVHIHRGPKAGWTALPNEALRDPRMSFKARGVLCTLLSHEDGWQQSMAFTLTEASDGRDATRSALVELEALGYAQRVRKQSKSGQWVTEIHVYDSLNPAGAPASAEPAPDDPMTETPALDVEALDVEPLGEEPLEALAEQTLGRRSNALAKVYHDRQPMSRFPAIAGIARTALEAGFPDEEVAAALLRLADERRSVTVESLRIELQGLPPRRKVESAAAQTLREAQQLRALESSR